MLGDVGQPFLIQLVRGEITLHEIITHRRTSTLIPTLSLRNDRLDASDLAQSPHPPLRDVVAEVLEVVGENPIPALEVILVQTRNTSMRCRSSSSRAETGCLSHW